MTSPLGVCSFFDWLLRNSWQTAVMVGLVMAVQWVFRKRLSPSWRYNLWLLVLLRLALPFSPQSGLSVFNIKHVKAPVPMGAAVASLFQEGQGMREPIVRTAPSPQEPRSFGREETAPAKSVEPAVLPVSISTPSIPAAPAGRSARFTYAAFVAMLPWLWFSGLILYLCRIASQNLFFASRLRKEWRPVAEPVQALLERCREEVRVRSRLQAMETSLVRSPALYGLFTPKLLLPRGLAESFDAAELRYVFLHELAHVKRRDMLFNWVLCFFQGLHWFNPVVWLGFSRVRADRELACDALALSCMKEGEKQPYGATIIKMLERFTPAVSLPSMIGILEDKRQMRARIRLIASFKKPSRWSVLAAVLLVVLGAVALTDAQTQKSGIPVAPQKGTNVVAEIRRGADPEPVRGGTNEAFRAVTVTVLDAANGQPVEGAEVFADRMAGSSIRRLTDPRGQYRFQVPLPPKDWKDRSTFSVRVKAGGFAPRAVSWTSSADIYDQMPLAAELKLKRGITIGGIVRDENGTPLSGIQVSVEGWGVLSPSRDPNERRKLQQREGPFVGLRPGESNVVTDLSGRWTFDQFPSDLELVMITLISPDGTRSEYYTKEMQPEVSLGALIDRTAVLSLKKGITMRGIVVDESGNPLPGVTLREGYGGPYIRRISEFVSGSDGKFEKMNRAPRQWVYTASAAGKATTSVVVDVKPGMSEMKIVMQPAAPVVMQIIGEDGKPLPGSRVSIDDWHTEGQILSWSGISGADGKVVWTNAPRAMVTFVATHEAYPGLERKLRARGGDPEKQVVMSRASLEKITLNVKAVDAASHAPVTVTRSSVAAGNDSDPFIVLSEPKSDEFSVTLEKRLFPGGIYPNFLLKLEADEYEPATTGSLDFLEGDQTIELSMHRTGAVKPTLVLLPDGRPAARAKVWVCPESLGPFLFYSKPGEFNSGGQLESVVIGKDGLLKESFGAGNRKVFITHNEGMLETTLPELKLNSQVKLNPWGRIEGQLKVAGKPKPHENVFLGNLMWRTGGLRFCVMFTVQTDDNARFSFSDVPPGEYKIYRGVSSKADRYHGITETYQMPVVVEAGETVNVEYSSTGRSVVGQAVPGEAGAIVDWQRDVHVLALYQPPLPVLKSSDFADRKVFTQLYNASLMSPEHVQHEREARTYPLVFEKDGSFRIDDVPPGKYRLKIAASEELSPLEQEVVVPEGEEAFDLGIVKVALKKGTETAKAPPAMLHGTTLGGQPFDLAKLRGKHVLIGFWASWSEHSAPLLERFKELQQEYAEDGQLAFVTISMDKETDDIKTALSKGDYSWLQARLDGKERVNAIKTFGVETLPMAVLIDPDGRVIGSGLEGDRLGLAVERALRRK